MSAQPSDITIIPNGAVVNGFQVISLINIGGYGPIYKVKDKSSGKTYAMKTEIFDFKTSTIPGEINVMKELKGSYFPKYRDSGNIEKYQVNYVVMTYLGASVGEIQMYHDRKLTLDVAYNFAYKMFFAIKAFHSLGFVHQDIKPSNFLTQLNPKYPVILIDFNHSRQFIDPLTKEPFPCQKVKEFTGTKNYASINCLQLLPGGRKDDLISWFYCFLELACGQLPWGYEDDPNEIISIRETFKISDLRHKFPNEIQQIYDMLKKLSYEEKPDYEGIQVLFETAMRAEKIDDTKFDWESFIKRHSESIKTDDRMGRMKSKYEHSKERATIRKRNSEKQDVKQRGLDDLDDDEDHSKKKKHHNFMKKMLCK